MNAASRSASTRNVQLDFFRGLALMVIFVNHMPDNPWSYFMPSRLGPSDAAEAFVFLSGFVAAIAYGRSFREAGIGLGTLQVLYRCGQIYVAHLLLFISITSLFLLLHFNGLGDGWQLDNLHYFFDQTQNALLALVSLTYLPNFIDILPMYLVILLWVPMIWSLSRIHVLLAIGGSLALYICAWSLGWELMADPISGRHWYFNPFCWQLIFFTGFAFSSGWLPIPRFNRNLFWACMLFVVFCLPLGTADCYELPWFTTLQNQWPFLVDKSHFGLIRFLHFLAMTYLVRIFMQKHQEWLNSWLAGKVINMGQQSLPVFMMGSVLSLVGGILLETSDGDVFDSTCINVAGLGVMMLFAQFLNWLDQKPWKISLEKSSNGPTVDWPRYAVMACSLVLIAMIPLLLIQQPETQINMAESSGNNMSLPHHQDAPQKTEKAAFQKSPLESPDTL